MKNSLSLALLCALALPAVAQNGPVYQPLYSRSLGSDSSTPTPGVEGTYTEPLGSALETQTYPVATRWIDLTIEKQRVRMFYMDAASGMMGGIAPYSPRPLAQPVAVLLHGKNFGGDYWEGPMRALVAAGYRVIVPDQIGFGKSSKPEISYSFDLLAQNTAKLLDSLGVKQAVIVGHSMGGMLATRFAVLYPERVTKLVLEDPIGLEDYSLSIPAQPLETVFQNELADTDPTKIRAFFKRYFVTWKPEYEKFVETKARQGLGGEWPRVAMASALTYQMIYQQPVVGQFSRIQAPTLLVVGLEDRTVVGRNYGTPEGTKDLGNYPELGKKTAKAIPGAKLVEIPGVGHIPHLEAPDKFNSLLLDFLKQ